MSFDQDLNEQANISGADLAILIDELKDLKQQLSEAKRQAVPEGMALVPIEPTEKMLDEICLVEEFTYTALSARYKAMLSTAPQPSPETDIDQATRTT